MILVVGSTGSLGTAVTKKLAAAGRKVTALVRDPASEKAGALKAAGAKLVACVDSPKASREAIPVGGPRPASLEDRVKRTYGARRA